MIISRMKMSASMKMKNISESMVLSIFDAYRNYRIRLSESYGYQQAQVTSGGVSLGDIKDDMAFNDHHGIFVIGELLDVDGIKTLPTIQLLNGFFLLFLLFLL